MKLLLLLVLNISLCSLSKSIAQSLSSERIAKIKSCTVRITVEGTNSVGTGFFINEIGTVLTCWHVIEPAMVKDSANKLINLKNVYITLSTGEKIEVGFFPYFLSEGYADAIGYDFCVLNLLIKRKTPFLKVGSFENIKEGQDIYTCGFPVSIEQMFVSKGMVSTIFTDTLNSIFINGKPSRMPRNQALLDLTLNAGNSGGAIIKLGNTIEEDEVVGVADFIINPIGDNNAKDMIKLFSKGINKYNLEGTDPNKAFIYFTQVLSTMSLGVSGCISINHFLNSLSKIKN
jgi:serine protease Do